MVENLPSMSFKKEKSNPTIESENSYYALPFKKDSEYMRLLDNYVKFIKSVEKILRSSGEYKAYISHLKKDLGLVACQVTNGVEDFDNKVTIEMHHGPVLTLFDCVSIIVNHNIRSNIKMTTYSVADQISQDHFDHLIQVVMLTKTNHELVHSRDIILHFNQAWGDLNKFLIKYRRGLNLELIEKIKRYMDLCERYDFFTNDVLEINNKIDTWLDELEDIYLD